MGVNSLPKTVTGQRHGYDLNPGPSAPESSTLPTRLLSHPNAISLMYVIHQPSSMFRGCEKCEQDEDDAVPPYQDDYEALLRPKALSLIHI